jgi:hypothetical protein
LALVPWSLIRSISVEPQQNVMLDYLRRWLDDLQKFAGGKRWR